jgi:hypothetical protein
MITFRCENCGKLLETQSPQQETVRCPSCRRRSTVPKGLSTLPSPIIPPSGAPATPEALSPPPAEAAAEEMPVDEMPADEMPAEASWFENILAPLMPWAMSLLLHAGVLLILLFAVAMATSLPPPRPPVETTTPDSSFSPEAPSEKLGLPGPEGPGPHLTNDPRAPSGPLPPGEHLGWAPVGKDTTSGKGWGMGSEAGTAEAYGFGGAAKGGGGGTGDFGMARGGGTAKSGFYGAGGGGGGGGNAWNVIYVLDSSGSVVGSFDSIRQELKNSVFQLNLTNNLQTVHVIFFCEDAFQEAPSRRLVTADAIHKREISTYVDTVVAQGYGSSPIPAMIRAFNAFKNSNKKGQVMYILTDGDFDSSKYAYTAKNGQKLQGTPAVIEWLRENNPDIKGVDKAGKPFTNKFVHVYVIILGDTPSSEVEESMKTIAKENSGEYKFVPR